VNDEAWQVGLVHWEPPAPPAKPGEAAAHANAMREFDRRRENARRPLVVEKAEALKAPRFALLDAVALSQRPEPQPLVKPLLWQGGFSAVVAPYSAYKSFFALGIALSIANGLDCYGLPVTRGPVVYQAGEGTASLHRRVEAWRTLNGLPDVGNIYFLPQSLKLNEPRDLADLLAAIRNLPTAPAFIVFDTFARSLRGNENGQEDTGLYVEAVDAIREATGAHVQIVHHTGWEGSRSRGSSNIPASLDTELTLMRDADRVTVSVTKQKDAEEYPAFTLEALPVAGSMALRAIAPTSPKMSDSERGTLEVVQRLGCTKATPWQDEADAAGACKRRMFYNAKKRLLGLAYVRETREGFVITDAGRLALGAQS
jgi:hypothetical protein